MADRAAILYGEFVQSIYDTINPYEGSFSGFPLYGKSNHFAMAHLGAEGLGKAYTITRYIYCTVKGVNILSQTGTAWMGYVAESNEEETKRLGRRDIVVAIRGTLSDAEWIQNFSFAMADFDSFVPTPKSGAKVHGGFLSIYTASDPKLNFGAKSMKEQIFDELRRLLSSGAAEAAASVPVRITITGHSLGAALATLAACDVGCNLVPDFAGVTVSLITFGSPRVGNDQFKTIAEKHIDLIERYRSMVDPVPLVPPYVLLVAPYVHVGDELVLDWQPSPYVANTINLLNFKGHNMELHLHTLSGEVCTSAMLADKVGDGTSTIDDICKNSGAWDDASHDLLKQKLEAVKDYLKDDPAQLEAFLKEVNYIAVNRSSSSSQSKATSSPYDKRDYSLLNKSDDILKAEYNVPGVWLVHPHKDMVRHPLSKQWLPRTKRPSDIPTPDNPEYN